MFGALYTRKQRGRKLQFIAMGSDFTLEFCLKHCAPSRTDCYVIIDDNGVSTSFSIIGG